MFNTAEANLSSYTIYTIRQVVKRVYFAKKEQRMAKGQHDEASQ
jgi:hypothetical protein